MVEWRQILQVAQSTRDAVLITLVGVQGSSYRQVGARLLLTGDGVQAGSVSGGCLEGDLMRRAKWLINKGPVLLHYSTAFDSTDEIPFGLGCGGELDLLLEGVGEGDAERLFAGVRQVLSGERRQIVTWLPGPGRELRRAVFGSTGISGAGEETWEVLSASPTLRTEELRWAAELAPGEGGATVFVEWLEPPQRLLVLGAGEDARPMVALGAMLGWNVVVADGRRQLARAERFPAAEQVLVIEEGRPPEVRAGDAVVLMTHSYEQDRELLAAILPAEPRYLGLLGARHRSSLLVSEVAARLGWPIAACCERLYAPVGLDLGGDGAEAIALAVIAEIQACVQGKLGASRRLSAEEVREQARSGGSSQYLQVHCALDEA